MSASRSGFCSAVLLNNRPRSTKLHAFKTNGREKNIAASLMCCPFLHRHLYLCRSLRTSSNLILCVSFGPFPPPLSRYFLHRSTSSDGPRIFQQQRLRRRVCVIARRCTCLTVWSRQMNPGGGLIVNGYMPLETVRRPRPLICPWRFSLPG